MDIKPGKTIEGPQWPEPVEVNLFEDLGDYVRIIGVTVTSRVHVDRLIKKSELAEIEAEKAIPFCAAPRSVFLSLEAKCYDPGLDGGNINTVGVKETSRLISRLRHRQFGVLVTTSAISKQAYEELRQDRHPVIILCGRDIANLLIEKGFNSREVVNHWLTNEFPVP